MERVAWVQRREDPRVVGEADAGVRLGVVDVPVGPAVRDRHVAQGRARRAPVAVGGRALAEQVRLHRVHVRLVDRDPVGDEVTQGVHDDVDQPQEPVDRMRRRPRAEPLEPRRVAEVVQRDQRHDAGRAHGGDLLAVPVEGLARDLAGAGFDARPLHRHAVGLQPQGRHQVGVLAPPVPVVGGTQRRGPVGDRPRQLGPVVPVVVAVTTLDLQGRRGHPDQQVAGGDQQVSGHGPATRPGAVVRRRSTSSRRDRCARRSRRAARTAAP